MRGRWNEIVCKNSVPTPKLTLLESLDVGIFRSWKTKRQKSKVGSRGFLQKHLLGLIAPFMDIKSPSYGDEHRAFQ